MGEQERKNRRPRGQAALGDIDETKRVVEAMISNEEAERHAKTARLRQLRLAAERAATNNAWVADLLREERKPAETAATGLSS